MCTCVVLSWDVLKVRKNLLDSDYKIFMMRLLVAIVNRHKSLQFVKKSTFFIYDFVSRFDYYITPGYYFLTGARVLRCVFPFLIYIISKSRNNCYWHKWIFTMYKDFCLRWIENIKICAFFSNRCFSGSEAVKSGVLLQRYWNFYY